MSDKKFSKTSCTQSLQWYDSRSVSPEVEDREIATILESRNADY
jgi:hypothetical protein